MPADPAQAVHWYTMAAEQGDAPAQERLGWCFLEGRGTEPSLPDAHRWFRESAAQDLSLIHI